MNQSAERDWLTEESIRDHIDAGGTLLNNEQARFLLDEIDRLRKSREHHRQTALDISEDNDQLQKQIEEQNLRMQDLFLKAERLEKLVPPEIERGPGFVGQGSWAVFAEKVVEERDAAREQIKYLIVQRQGLDAEVNRLRDNIRDLCAERDEVKENVRESTAQDLEHRLTLLTTAHDALRRRVEKLEKNKPIERIW
jgi:uncharacterized coiled-coil DUF342 family protein